MKIRKDKEKLAKAQNKEVAPAAPPADATEKTASVNEEGVNKDSITKPQRKRKAKKSPKTKDTPSVPSTPSYCAPDYAQNYVPVVPLTADGRGRWWTFVIWSDSCMPNWKQIMETQHIPWACSPLHAAADNEETDIGGKKAHWHIMVQFCGKIGFEEAVRFQTILFQQGKAPKSCQYVKNPSSMVRYLAHMDHPDKHQYDPATIEFYSGARDLLERHLLSAADRTEMFLELIAYVCRYHIDNLMALTAMTIVESRRHPGWFDCVRTSQPMWERWCKAVRYGKQDKALDHFMLAVDFVDAKDDDDEVKVEVRLDKLKEQMLLQNTNKPTPGGTLEKIEKAQTQEELRCLAQAYLEAGQSVIKRLDAIKAEEYKEVEK